MAGFNFFRRKLPGDTPPPTSPAQLRQETAAMPPSLALPPAAPQPALSGDAVAKMQRMLDIITISGAQGSPALLQAALAKRDFDGFVAEAQGYASGVVMTQTNQAPAGKSNWAITRDVYDESKNRAVEQVLALSQVQVLDGLQSGFDPSRPGGLDKLLARYTDGTAEANASYAKGDARRMVTAGELIHGATGERREWLIAVTAKMFDRSAGNPHFAPALAEMKDKASLNAVLASFGRDQLQAQPGLAGKNLSEDDRAVLSLGLSWASKTPPVGLHQPIYPQQAGADDRKLYEAFNFQHSVVAISNGRGEAVTGLAREQMAIRDTLSAYAKDTGQENNAGFQAATLTRLVKLGVTGPKEVYPSPFQQHVAATVAKFSAPAGGTPAAARHAPPMKPF